jgi:hypothetical protein
MIKLSVKSPSLSPPIPSFQWYSQSNEIIISLVFQWYPQSNENFIKSQYEILKLIIECTRFKTNYSSCIGRSSENICSSIGGAQEKGKRGMKLSLPPKSVEKLVWVPIISFCKISFPVMHLMAYFILKPAVLAPIIACPYG